MKVLVTGGAGFIGSHIAQYHIAKNDSVIVLDDLSTGSLSNLLSIVNHDNFHFIQTNMCDGSSFQDQIKDVEVVYHFAAKVGVLNVCENPLSTMQVNVDTTYHLFEALKLCKNLQRVFFASTSEVYGKNCHRDIESSTITMPDLSHATASYAISKIAGENMALTHYLQNKMPVTILRLFNMIGPKQTGQYGMVVPRFVRQALTKQPITVFGEGNQTRSFCDIRDFVNMLELLLRNQNSIGEIINIGKDQEITIFELAQLVKTYLNSSSSIMNIPYREAYNRHYVDTMQRVPDIQKLQDLIAYEFQYSLAQTITDVAKSQLLNVSSKAA